MFYLYHIKGKKWGCTKHLKRRLKVQGFEMSDVAEIIEVLDKNTAAEKEKKLNLDFGYRWSDREDYRVVTKITKSFTNKARSKGGKIQSSKIIVCPHCRKIGKGMIMGRWHMDNCKLKI